MHGFESGSLTSFPAKKGPDDRFDETLFPEPFDRVFHLHSRIREEYLSALRTSQTGPALDVSTCYTASTDFNAAAVRQGTSFWITFTVGTPAVLYDLFFRMLGTGEVFSDIGTADEGMVPRHDRIVTNAGPLLEDAGNPLGLSYVPTCKYRRAIAEYLVLIVCDAMFAHEYQHITGGHLHYLFTDPFCRMVEFGDSPAGRDDALLRQALEIDADAAAIRWSLKATMDTSHNRWRYDPVLSSYLREPERALRLWTFAIITMFRLAHESHVGIGSPVYGVHPPPLVRLYFARTIVDYLLQDYPVLMDPPSMFDFVFDEVQRGLCAITQTLPRRQGFSKIGSKEFCDHVNNLVSVWRGIRPELGAIASSWGGSNAPEEYFPYVSPSTR
ncbi:MAG TPA: hypothetical protein VF615_18250 [Longimicrobiaceae bacterium]|jgi:hypothetical protein